VSEAHNSVLDEEEFFYSSPFSIDKKRSMRETKHYSYVMLDKPGLLEVFLEFALSVLQSMYVHEYRHEDS